MYCTIRISVEGNTHKGVEMDNMKIDYKYFLLYKRLFRKFRLETISRHWDRLEQAINHAKGKA